MEESERRRKELLDHARAFYGGRPLPPAVHPRYTGTYRELYGEEEPAGSFGIRLAICCLLFALFVAMDYRGVEVAQVSGGRIVDAIEEEPVPEKLWENL